MTLRKIIKMPNSFLRKKASFVDKIDDEIKKLLSDMLETMYNANGIGLAATQIGVDKRVIVMDCGQKTGIDDKDSKPNPIKMINPEITFFSKTFEEREEGCLSIPGYNAIVKRPNSIVVKYLNENNIQKELKANDLLSVCIQHEIDHLDGILFIDHLSRIKKEMIIKKINKEKLNQKEIK